jgi:hypothetical protein
MSVCPVAFRTISIPAEIEIFSKIFNQSLKFVEKWINFICLENRL